MFGFLLLAEADGGSSYGLPIFFAVVAVILPLGFWIYFRSQARRQKIETNGIKGEKNLLEEKLKNEFNQVLLHERTQSAKLIKNVEEELARADGQLLGKAEECASLMQERAKLIKANQDLDKHKELNPAYKKQIYNIAVIGITSSGKTALLMRLIDPLAMDINNFVQSGVDVIHDRPITVTHNPSDAVRIEHVFRFHEWGGEHLVSAQRDMLKMCQRDVAIEKEGVTDLAGIQGIIFAVDLGDFERDEKGRPVGPQRLHLGRIATQCDEYFSGHKLPFLLNDTVLSRCHVVVLFINKIDLMVGPSEITKAKAEKAEEHYSKLILGLRHACGRTPVEVIVGSAESDISLTKVYSSLVRKVIPESARKGNLGKAQQHKIRSPTSPPEGVPSPSEAGAVPVSGPSSAAGHVAEGVGSAANKTK